MTKLSDRKKPVTQVKNISGPKGEEVDFSCIQEVYMMAHSSERKCLSTLKALLTDTSLVYAAWIHSAMGDVHVPYTS